MQRQNGSPATTLHSMLAAAARSTNWEREVIHRCAWCSRVADADNVYRAVGDSRPIGAVTDGICPDCWADAMQRLADWKQRQVALAA
jgi:hypothetical protein